MPLRFVHASAITEDELIYGIATIEWQLASNAGTLDGFGPILTNTTFTTQVAEALAVTIHN